MVSQGSYVLFRLPLSVAGTTDTATALLLRLRVLWCVFVPVRAMRFLAIRVSTVRREGAPIVLSLRDGLQMARVETGAIAAQVVDVQTFWYRAFRKLVGQGVDREYLGLTIHRARAYPVSVSLSPRPNPALVGIGKLREALIEVHSLYRHTINIPRLVAEHNTGGLVNG